MMFNFKRQIEKFLLDESGVASKKGVLLGGLIGFALSASAAHAYNQDIDIKFDKCWALRTDGKLTFKMEGSSNGVPDYGSFGAEGENKVYLPEDVFVKLYGTGNTEGFTKVFSNYPSPAPELDVADHLYHCDGWCLAGCYASDHFNVGNHIDLGYTGIHHKNALSLEATDDSHDEVSASHTHEIARLDIEQVDWQVNDHFSAGDGTCYYTYSDGIREDDIQPDKYVCEDEHETWDGAHEE